MQKRNMFPNSTSIIYVKSKFKAACFGKDLDPSALTHAWVRTGGRCWLCCRKGCSCEDPVCSVQLCWSGNPSPYPECCEECHHHGRRSYKISSTSFCLVSSFICLRNAYTSFAKMVPQTIRMKKSVIRSQTSGGEWTNRVNNLNITAFWIKMSLKLSVSERVVSFSVVKWKVKICGRTIIIHVWCLPRICWALIQNEGDNKNNSQFSSNK